MRTILELSLIIIGIPGNILILAVFGSKRNKISAHIFIIGLAIADLTECLSRPFVLFVFLPQNAYYRNNIVVICKLEYFFPFLSIFVSVLLTTAIAFDRYFAICKPHAHVMTIRRAKITVLVCLAFSVVFAIPPLITFGLREIPYVGNVCMVTAPEWILTLLFCCFYLVGILGVLLIIILYARIYWVLRQRQRVGAAPVMVDEAATQQNTTNSDTRVESLAEADSDVPTSNIAVISQVREATNGNEHQIQQRRGVQRPNIKSKTTTMLVITTFVFILTWIPVIATFRIHPVKLLPMRKNNPFAYTLVRFCKVLMLVNHMINPFIYGIVSRRFRDDAKSVMRKIKRRLFVNLN